MELNVECRTAHIFGFIIISLNIQVLLVSIACLVQLELAAACGEMWSD